MASNQFKNLSEGALRGISLLLKTLADPTRIKILRELHDGEKSVSTLVNDTGGLQANISKHLQLMSRAHLVTSRKEGLSVYYRIADPCVKKICNSVCGAYSKLLKTRLKELEE